MRGPCVCGDARVLYRVYPDLVRKNINIASDCHSLGLGDSGHDCEERSRLAIATAIAIVNNPSAYVTISQLRLLQRLASCNSLPPDHWPPSEPLSSRAFWSFSRNVPVLRGRLWQNVPSQQWKRARALQCLGRTRAVQCQGRARALQCHRHTTWAICGWATRCNSIWPVTNETSARPRNANAVWARAMRARKTRARRPRKTYVGLIVEIC